MPETERPPQQLPVPTSMQPRHPSPPPLRPNALRVVSIVTGLWVVALIVLLVVRSRLAPTDRWWVWVTVAGIALGGYGIAYFARRPYHR